MNNSNIIKDGRGLVNILLDTAPSFFLLRWGLTNIFAQSRLSIVLG
jgi:hypothetical protein